MLLMTPMFPLSIPTMQRLQRDMTQSPVADDSSEVSPDHKPGECFGQAKEQHRYAKTSHTRE